MSGSSLLTAEQIPTDNVVDPAVYVVGPGDVLAYQTTGLDFTEKLAVITPENTMLMERVGLINVAGMTLRELRDSVRSIIKQRAPGVEVFLTLKRARLAYVTIRGNVPYPGTYAVPASMRVGTFIVVSRQPWLLRKDVALPDQVRTSGTPASQTTSELLRSGGPQLSAYALRNIVVRHHDGVTLVDIARSRLPGGAKYNPHVREGDVVNVPYDNGMQPTISIAGAVATPATVVFKEGDRASLLLAAAGGALEDADLDRVALVQAGGQGKIQLNVDANLNLVGDDPQLEPGSSIIVEQKVLSGHEARQGVVEVYGEVPSPGSVLITPGVTRVSDVISRVGGVQPAASLSLSYVIRPDRSASSARELSERSSRTFMYSDLKLEDTVRYQLDQFNRIPFVSCDLATALKDTASAQNITLQNGDVIVIENTPDRVFVYGQVQNPGYVPFVARKSLEWYVEQAGGFAAGAEEGRSRIIRGKTKVWVESDDDVFVQPGDEVYVPRPPAIPPGMELQTLAVVAGIVSSVVALTATIVSLAR
jgi:protein involved in polysaccharide export with SLBB domain